MHSAQIEDGSEGLKQHPVDQQRVRERVQKLAEVREESQQNLLGPMTEA